MSNDVPDWSSQGHVFNAITSSQVTVGVTAVEVAAVAGQQSVALRCDQSNAGTVYVAGSSGVSSSDWFMLPGDFLVIDGAVSVWLIASQAGQLVYVLQGS